MKIKLVDGCHRKFKEDQSRITKHVQRGAEMYFIRLACGHINEGLKIIEEIKNNTKLRELIERCPQEAKDSFCSLENYLKGGAGWKKFNENIRMIRNTTIFHYDKKLVMKALEDRASREEARRSKIILGSIGCCRFELADDIVDSIVCRQICKIPRNADLRKEIDEIMVWANNIRKSLIIFSGVFICRYLDEHAVI